MGDLTLNPLNGRDIGLAVRPYSIGETAIVRLSRESGMLVLSADIGVLLIERLITSEVELLPWPDVRRLPGE